jgi:hypothetical protein
LIVAGAAMFGASYITSALLAGSLIDAGDDGGVALYIPFVGPVICIGTCDLDGAEASVSLLLVLDALVQIAGVTMFTLGFVLQSPVQRQVTEVEGPIFGVRPWMSPTAAGVSFTGTNF